MSTIYMSVARGASYYDTLDIINIYRICSTRSTTHVGCMESQEKVQCRTSLKIRRFADLQKLLEVTIF